MIVAIEGIDGAGKNTLSRVLQARTAARVMGFPRYDDSIEGWLIRSALYGQLGDVTDSPYAMATLFALDRYHAQGELAPYAPGGNRRGQLVICDRYAASNAAYSVARTGDRQMATWVRQLEFERMGIVRPDLHILVDTSVDEAGRRARARANSSRPVDTYEADKDLQLATLRAYRRMAQESWVSRWKVVDGSVPIDALSAVVDEVVSILGCGESSA